MNNQDFVRAFEGWHLYRDFYGNATCVEATITYSKEKFYLGVGLDINFEGSYQLRLTDKIFDETGMYQLSLCKRTFTINGLCSIKIDPEEYGILKDKQCTLRLERDGAQLIGYLNGHKLLCYEEHDMQQTHEAGGCGVWIHPENGATFSNFSCKGEEKPLPAHKEEPTSEAAIEYEMDFGNVSCWSSDPRDEAWKVLCHDGTTVYQSPQNEKCNQVHLHAFENDPYVKMKFSSKDVAADGSFGLLLRHAPHTAYVKVGYDVQKKCWFVEDVPAFYDCSSQRFESNNWELTGDKIYEMEVITCEDVVTMRVDKVEVLRACGLRQTGFGRIGLFAENATLSVHAFYAKMPHACPVIDGVVKTYVDENHFAASTEIEVTTDGRVVGITKDLYPRTDIAYQTGIYRSNDMGLTFEKVLPEEAYSGLDTFGAYQSVLRMKNGKYIQVLSKRNTLVQESEDMIHWKDIGQVYSEDDYDKMNQQKGHILFHVNSLAEYADQNGKTRIFLPITETIKFCDPSTQRIAVKHDTAVYYSDDDGHTWMRSKNTAYDVLRAEGFAVLDDFAESKIVQCADGNLRLYNSRNGTRFLCYLESDDFGVTWKGFNTIREMQCARSSFGVAEDPYNPGTYYMAWVNNTPLYRNASQGRIRMSLARSYDGKNWHFVGDAEYTSLRYADKREYLYFPLFQILDPSVTVTEDYVYVTYGLSAFADRGDTVGQLKHVHHEQRPALTRFEKGKLKDIPWDATNVSDMSLLNDYGYEEVLI